MKFDLSAFLIYHDDDLDAAASFVDEFGSMFNAVHTRGVTNGDDFVACASDGSIVQAIRSRYVRDASLGIVLLGTSTWSRRFVDWEIAAAIGGEDDPALPLVLFDLHPRARSRTPLPPRLTTEDGLTFRRVDVPQSTEELAAAVRSVRTRSMHDISTENRVGDPLLRSDLN